MKTWDECCDQVAKKYSQVIIDDLDSPEAKVAAHLNRLHAEAAELYREESIREAIKLGTSNNEETVILLSRVIDWLNGTSNKSLNEIYMQLVDLRDKVDECTEQ